MPRRPTAPRAKMKKRIKPKAVRSFGLLRVVLSTFLGILTITAAYYLLPIYLSSAQNFLGPQNSPGVGPGAIGIDAANNLSIGSSTPIADTKLFIVASSTADA